MLGIVKTYKDGELIDVFAKNDCDFEFNRDGIQDDALYSKGYVSLGTVYKYNPIHADKYGYTYRIDVYKNCNDDVPLYVATVTDEEVILHEPKETRTYAYAE